VVEDERPLARALRRTLEAEGFSVMLAANGIDGDWAAREHDEADALDIGADDFVSKPFSPVVLVARLRALLRRSSAGPDPSLTVGSLRVEPERRRAWLGEQELHLTARELGLLSYLVAVRRGRWLVVPAVVLAVRMLLDPGAYPYYPAGLVLATILVDVGWRQTRWPWASMGVVVGLYAVRYLGPLTPTDAVLGWLRAVTLLGVLAVALGPGWRLRSARVCANDCRPTGGGSRLWDSASPALLLPGPVFRRLDG
ncbi:MAG: response regulator transcription factor, partial [Dermatophilaceae bacterium]